MSTSTDEYVSMASEPEGRVCGVCLAKDVEAMRSAHTSRANQLSRDVLATLLVLNILDRGVVNIFKTVHQGAGSRFNSLACASEVGDGGYSDA
jgi:hypothetical protein